jgi:uncharacterized protein (DUF433 family)/DNA-binding transcriptional MerR regulator
VPVETTMRDLAALADYEAARIEPGRGVYDAGRAAALAGVPRSTLHFWAREGIYRPSVAPGPRVRLWSWGDLLALRAVDWFRPVKGEGAPLGVSMRLIRQALAELDEQGIARDRLHEVLVVSHAGDLYFQLPGAPPVHAAPGRQAAMVEVLRPVRPYHGAPDLLEPRPLLRILPGKLHGEPHLLGTRITSVTVYALHAAGYTRAQIRTMYPEAQPEGLDQAVELEESLQERTRAA